MYLTALVKHKSWKNHSEYCASFSYYHVEQLFQSIAMERIKEIIIDISQWRMHIHHWREAFSQIVPLHVFAVLYEVYATIAAMIHNMMSGLKLLLLFWKIYQMLSGILEISSHTFI